MDPLLDNFKAACNLGREIAIDESMIGFKGRLHFIQYMPDKPIKSGMKASFLQTAEPAMYTPGSCTQVNIYIWVEVYQYTHLC